MASFPEFNPQVAARKADLSFRNAAAEITLVGIIIVSGLYYFGTSLNNMTPMQPLDDAITGSEAEDDVEAHLADAATSSAEDQGEEVSTTTPPVDTF